MFKIWILISLRLMMMFTLAKMTEGLECKRSSSVLNGTPCRHNGEVVSDRKACEAMSPKCCSFSVGFLSCFVNKDYKENQVCNKKEISLVEQLAIDSDKHDELFAVGPVLSTHQVVSELHCLDLCYRNHLCNVYNYQYGGRRSKTKVCELLLDVDTIGTKRDFRYRMVDHNERKVLFTNSECKETQG
ncbi:uncharacterized protein LOC116301655 isoform X2 [Actinia tenebrosa]|nr:uncharacterized protein LOC116301655 isoform X2 [Actinia tenebrosa]